MKVKNYYQMDEKELDEAINLIRYWLFNYSVHKRRKRALFALEVALSAKELKRDSFTKLLIEYLT